MLLTAASRGNLLVPGKAGGVTGLKANTKPVSALITHLRTNHPLSSSPNFPNQYEEVAVGCPASGIQDGRGEHPNVRAPIPPGVLMDSEMEAEGSGLINLL